MYEEVARQKTYGDLSEDRNLVAYITGRRGDSGVAGGRDLERSEILGGPPEGGEKEKRNWEWKVGLLYADM